MFARLKVKTEEIGGYRVLQMVNGQPAAIYRFVPSASMPPKSKVTIWAGSRLTEEQTRRLKTDSENIIWKDLEAWGAGMNCTTIFAKSTGEALCWVHGAVMLDTAKTELPPAEAQKPLSEPPVEPPAEETLQDEPDTEEKKPVDDPAVDVIWKPSNSAESQKRSKSPYNMLTPEELPQQQPTFHRRSSRVRVDEFDLNHAASSASTSGEERSKATTQLSVSDTQPLRAYASAQKLAAQGLHALKAPHNLRFQPSMFTTKFPLAQS